MSFVFVSDSCQQPSFRVNRINCVCDSSSYSVLIHKIFLLLSNWRFLYSSIRVVISYKHSMAITRDSFVLYVILSYVRALINMYGAFTVHIFLFIHIAYKYVYACIWNVVKHRHFQAIETEWQRKFTRKLKCMNKWIVVCIFDWQTHDVNIFHWLLFFQFWIHWFI